MFGKVRSRAYLPVSGDKKPPFAAGQAASASLAIRRRSDEAEASLP
jgi:hypothetical protein